MISSSQPYGEVNSFPAWSPVIILFLSYVVEGLFGSQLPEDIHKGLVAVASIFTYGILFLAPLSYSIFKNIVLPVLNWLGRNLKIQSYFLNCAIVLVVIEAILVCIFSVALKVDHKNIQWLRLIIAASMLTGLVAFNCIGHICIFKFRSRRSVEFK